MNVWAVLTTSGDGGGQDFPLVSSWGAEFAAVLELMVLQRKPFDFPRAGEGAVGFADRSGAAAQAAEPGTPVPQGGGAPAPVSGPATPAPQPAQAAARGTPAWRGSAEGAPEGHEVPEGPDIAQAIGAPAEEHPVDTRRAPLGWLTGVPFPPAAPATATTLTGELEVLEQGADRAPPGSGVGKAFGRSGGPKAPSCPGQGWEGAPQEMQSVKPIGPSRPGPVPARSEEAQPPLVPATPGPGITQGSWRASVAPRREPVVKGAPSAGFEASAGELEVPRRSEADAGISQQVDPPAGLDTAAPQPRPHDGAGSTPDRSLSNPRGEGRKFSDFATGGTLSQTDPQGVPAQPPRSDIPVRGQAEEPGHTGGDGPRADHPEGFATPPEEASDGSGEDRSRQAAGQVAGGAQPTWIRPEAHGSGQTWRTPDRGVLHWGEQVTEARTWPERPEVQPPPQRLQVEVPDARGDPVRVDVKARSEAVWVRVEGGPEVLQAVRGGQVDLQHALGHYGLSLAGLEVDTLPTGRRGPEDVPQPVGVRTSPAKPAGSVRVVAAGAVDYVV